MKDVRASQRMLEKTTSLLNRLDINYYVDSGTLLGIIRDKALIPTDHDIDIRILPNEAPDTQIPNLVKGLWEIGYTLIQQNPGIPQQLLCSDRATLLDLKFTQCSRKFLWYAVESPPQEDNDWRVHVFPLRFFEKSAEVEFDGRKYPAPSPVKEYLIYHYGESWEEFKTGENAKELTDASWDYFHNPHCSKSLEELTEMLKEERNATVS